MINFTTEVAQNFITGNEPQEIINLMDKVVIKPGTENVFYKKLSMKHGHLCPACEQFHETDEDWKLSLYQTQKDYVVRCYRDRLVGGESVYRVPLSKEQKKERKDQFKNKPLDMTTEFAYRRLVPTQDSKHVDFHVMNTPLLCVKA
jgi:hypothetical protein